MNEFEPLDTSMAIRPWNERDFHQAIAEDEHSIECMQEKALITQLQHKEDIARRALDSAKALAREGIADDYVYTQTRNEALDLLYHVKAKARAEYARELRIYWMLRNFARRNNLSDFGQSVAFPMMPEFMKDELNANNDDSARQMQAARSAGRIPGNIVHVRRR